VFPQPLLDGLGARAAIPLFVDDHDRAPVLCREGPEQLVGAGVKAGIVLPDGHFDVAPTFEGERVTFDDAMNLIALEQTRHRFGHVLVGDEEEEIVHSKTPAANRLPRSMALLHCARRGCSAPERAVAAPERSRRVITRSDTCPPARTTGEWVEIHTCWS
jgi:hypothetical protein